MADSGCFFRQEITPENPVLLNYRIWVQQGEMTGDLVRALSERFVSPPTVASRRRTACASSASSAATCACMVAHGTPCLGPVTHAGCGAICPAYDRGCYGCFGPMETPNTASLSRAGGRALGATMRGIVRAVPHLQRRRRAVPQGERGMRMRRVRPSRSTTWPASRARARCSSRSRTTVVTDVELGIFEPPRFFEAFLRGRDFTEAPDITARICGICPVAYQMSAVHAMESALRRRRSTASSAQLRRLLYCGEWIESHALHVYMLHAPDFLGYADAIAMAQDHPRRRRRGLRLKKAGQRDR